MAVQRAIAQIWKTSLGHGDAGVIYNLLSCGTCLTLCRSADWCSLSQIPRTLCGRGVLRIDGWRSNGLASNLNWREVEVLVLLRSIR